MTDPTVAPRRRHSWLWLTFGSGAALVVVLIVLASRVPLRSETLRQRVIATLSDRLDAEVELPDLHIRLFPRFHAVGSGLTIRHKRRHDVPPLISVKTLSVQADFLGLMRKHVSEVTLDGLEIDIPPGDHDGDDEKLQGAGRAGQAGTAAGAETRAETEKTRGTRKGNDLPAVTRDVVIDNLVASDARLVIIPRKKDKEPKVWAIHALHMRTVSFDRPMPFNATLTNAVPPGEIGTKGVFGPWQPGDPGATPLEGTFTFAKADLGFFKGISGILSAHGEFGGTLGRISIHGETTTPDFALDISGHKVPLHTDYHATVDGTNGDTLLDRIDAKLLNSHFIAKGSVIDLPGPVGHEVRLDVTMDDARLEDILQLTVKQAKAPMMGALKMVTKFVLPPGHSDVVDKLRLDGQFTIARAKFADLNVQQKLNELSQRSQGKTEAAGEQNVVSDFKGRFRLGNGQLQLDPLTFAMPGAGVQLKGAYGLKAETLDFSGTLLMDAKISETQTGVKRVLLKAIDPLFRKEGGGSAIPIRIQGKRSDPQFGLDKGRVFHRGG